MYNSVRASVVITSLFAVEHPLHVQVITILFLRTENEKNTFCFPFGPSSVCTSSYFLNDTHQLLS